jgi:hypothetical protein
MRRLIIAALTTLISLNEPLSTPQGHGLQSGRRPTLTVNLLGFRAQPAQAPASERGAAQSVRESITLEPGKPIERELSGGQSHSYKITMISGQRLRIVVEQPGVDVVVAMFTPDGKKILEVDGEQALDFMASRTTALKPELGAYRIVHFAIHGMLNNVHPELSGIVLSLVGESGQQQDGFLRLQDIYNLKLSAELVALSACQTGLCKEIKGSFRRSAIGRLALSA